MGMYSPLKPGLTLNDVRRTRGLALVPKHWARYVARMDGELIEARNGRSGVVAIETVSGALRAGRPSKTGRSVSSSQSVWHPSR